MRVLRSDRRFISRRRRDVIPYHRKSLSHRHVGAAIPTPMTTTTTTRRRHIRRYFSFSPAQTHMRHCVCGWLLLRVYMSFFVLFEFLSPFTATVPQGSSDLFSVSLRLCISVFLFVCPLVFSSFRLFGSLSLSASFPVSLTPRLFWHLFWPS